MVKWHDYSNHHHFGIIMEIRYIIIAGVLSELFSRLLQLLPTLYLVVF